MPTMGSLYFVHRLLVLLLCFLLHLNPSLPYSLKNCTTEYSEDALADGFLDCSDHKLVTIPDELSETHYNLLEQIHKEDYGDLSKLRILFLHENQMLTWTMDLSSIWWH